MRIALAVVLTAAVMLTAARLAVRVLQQEMARDLERLLVAETEDYLRAEAVA